MVNSKLLKLVPHMWYPRIPWLTWWSAEIWKTIWKHNNNDVTAETSARELERLESTPRGNKPLFLRSVPFHFSFLLRFQIALL
jgi:hypothetical protein